MANKRFLSGILVMALVFVMTVAGCKDNSGEDKGGNADLNGTWIDEEGNTLKLNKGSFEMSEDGSPMAKGTYTTSGSNMTITITHVHGSVAEGFLEDKWYSRSELKANPLIAAFLEDEMLDEIFTSYTGTYTLDGDTFTMTVDGETSTFTRAQT